MAKVTVAIPCCNHGAYLPEALDSVAAQTFDDYEIVVVDDGSTDPETLEVLNGLSQPNLRVIRTANKGVSAARNRAIAEASGAYILPLDADDVIAPNYLEKAVAVLDARPDVGIVYSDQLLFGEGEGVLILPDYDPRRLLVENLIHVSAVFRKEIWEGVGGYSEKMSRGWEDWDFWLATSGLGWTVTKLDEPSFHYRIRSDSRDKRMLFADKVAMFALMLWNRKILYLRHLGYLLWKLPFARR